VKNDINNFITVKEMADRLGISYFTLVSWIRRDIGKVLTNELAVKKGGWLIRKDTVGIFKHHLQTTRISKDDV